MKRLLLVLCFLLPLHVLSAQVVFNEVAWMGSVNSSSDEWIELYNSGTSTEDFTGWKITGKGNAQIVLLSGQIFPHDFFLIERSDDNAVPEVSANLVTSFGKGISNDGETLKLIDGNGTIVDSAIGGKNWTKLGGDRTSKQTPQRTSAGWITAPPTPGAQNKEPSAAHALAQPVKKVASNQEVNRTTKTKSTVTSAEYIAPMKKVSELTPPPEKKMIERIATSAASANVIWLRGGAKQTGRDTWLWILTATALVIIAGVIIARANISEPTEADKYAIIEDIIEGKEDEERLGDY